MRVSRELELAMSNDATAIKSVDVNYTNGDFLSGFISKVRPVPFGITICKHEVPREENSNFHLDFDKAKSITLVYHNGKTELYQ